MFPALDRLFRDEVDCCRVPGTSQGDVRPSVIFSGSFNPLHGGHLRMALYAAEFLGRDVSFELSISNVEKSTLDYDEVVGRLQQFEGTSVWVTRAPTFVEKSELFPRSTFVVGADTILRLGAERFYASKSARDQAVGRLSSSGCRFLVFGRLVEQTFLVGDTIPLAPEILELCDFVSEEEFRVDLSSSQLRDAGR